MHFVTLLTALSSQLGGDNVVETRGLSKRYRGGVLAVQGLDLSVRRGEVYGFLGTQPQSPENPEPAVGALQAIGVLLVYLALFLALSGLALRRRDVT